MNNVVLKDGTVVYEKDEVNTNYQDVNNFNEKFKVPSKEIPGFLDDDSNDFRIKFMKEELMEYRDACEEGDLATAFDSLVDLVYVAMGTAQMMGLRDNEWQELWDDVQRANMSKVRATSASQSKRGSSLDVIKPASWEPPKTDLITENIITRRKLENDINV